MPTITCQRCGLPGYVARPYSASAECPSCGAPLRLPLRRFEAERVGELPVEPAAAPAPGSVAGALALARVQLDMDVALLSEIRGGREVLLELAGDGFPLEPGASLELAQTYCGRILAGHDDHVIADAQRDPRVRDLALTRLGGVGAYVGVPLCDRDARLYMLCCLAREARPGLGRRAVRTLREHGERVLAALAADEPAG